MEAKTIETPDRAAESISAALDFLRGEAEAAGLSEVGELIQQASAKARERSMALPSKDSTERTAELVNLCKAIVALPDECRNALVFKKVYRRSYQEIADDCGVSVDTAKARVVQGFKLVRASLPAKPDCWRNEGLNPGL